MLTYETLLAAGWPGQVEGTWVGWRGQEALRMAPVWETWHIMTVREPDRFGRASEAEYPPLFGAMRIAS